MNTLFLTGAGEEPAPMPALEDTVEAIYLALQLLIRSIGVLQQYCSQETLGVVASLPLT